MHKTTLYLDDDLYDALRRLAEATDRTQAAIVREALLAYTSDSPRRRARSVGLGSSGDGSLSERVDELLDGMGEDR